MSAANVDFNDMVRRQGVEAVRAAISGAADASAPQAPTYLDIWLPADSDRFTIDELSTPPLPTEWAIPPYFPMNNACAITAAGGSSKTGTMVMFCVHICLGLELFGEHVSPGYILYISAEDRREILLRHLYANTQHLTTKERAIIVDRFVVKDLVGVGSKVTRHVDGQTIVAADVEMMAEFAATIPDLRLIVLDTLSRLNGGEESNEDLSRYVEGMERLARETGAAVCTVHHSGKAQMRAGVNDQYSGRGGSALSDNCRSVLHLTVLKPDDAGLPTNAGDLVKEGRLLRLSHVKSNYAAGAKDVYLERRQTAYAARLVPFRAEFDRGSNDASEHWPRIAAFLASQRDVDHPTSTTIDGLSDEYGSRTQRRRAIDWALDRKLLNELPHPAPFGKRKTYYALPITPAVTVVQADYRSASNGD